MEGGMVKVIAPFLKTKHKALFLYGRCFLRSKRGFSVLLELQRSWWREFCCPGRQSLFWAAEGIRAEAQVRRGEQTQAWPFLLSPSRLAVADGYCCLVTHGLQHTKLPLSSTISWRLLKPMSIESMMPSNHLILYCPLPLLPSVFPNIKVFSNELALCIRWAKYWSFCFSIKSF